MSSPTAIVVGASGYAGRELCGLVEGHPELELSARMTSRADADPARLSAEGLDALEPGRFGEADVVFLCTPHGAAASAARAALDAGARVVDLSADFRLRDPAVYSATYGEEHPAPELLAEAVYGLTERAREEVSGARLVANPGCYPTSILLPLIPALEAGLIEPGRAIVADSKSGVSGAGKAPTEVTHFGSVHENFRAYGVGTHRHTPEIHQGAGTHEVVFVPHLLPCFRGILSTLYLPPTAGVDATRVRTALQAAYADEPFVRVLEDGVPALADVQRTNRCWMGVAQAGNSVVVVSALDNLVKGAAGQALQNANGMLGLPEATGLSA